jgi:hypothetical protein
MSQMIGNKEYFDFSAKLELKEKKQLDILKQYFQVRLNTNKKVTNNMMVKAMIAYFFDDFEQGLLYQTGYQEPTPNWKRG